MGIVRFDEDQYLIDQKHVYALREEVEKIADKIYEEGIENIYFVGIGGTYAILGAVKTVLEKKTTLPVFLVSAAEIGLVKQNFLTKKSLVIMASETGNTKEVVAAAQILKEMGIRIVSFVCTAPSPLANLSTHYVLNPTIKGSEFQYQLLFIFIFRLLFDRNEFSDYDTFISSTKYMAEDFLAADHIFDKLAENFAKVYKNAPYQLWIASGNIWYEVYLFAMCILEEMQWIKTKSVSSAEFFHGTLEIVEKDTCVVLVKGEDETRVLDERVEKFVPKVSEQFTVIDLASFDLPHIDKKFRDILSPAFACCILMRLAYHLEKQRNHHLDTRRYYRQMEY